MEGMAPESARSLGVGKEGHKGANSEVTPDLSLKEAKAPPQPPLSTLGATAATALPANDEDAAENTPMDTEKEASDTVPLLGTGASARSFLSAMATKDSLVSPDGQAPGASGTSGAPDAAALDGGKDDDDVDTVPPIEPNLSVSNPLSSGRALLELLSNGAGENPDTDQRTSATLQRADSIRPPGAANAPPAPVRDAPNAVSTSADPQVAAVSGVSRRNVPRLERSDSTRPPGAARAPGAPALSTDFMRLSPMIPQESFSECSNMSGLMMISEYSESSFAGEKDEPGTSFTQPVEVDGVLRPGQVDAAFDLYNRAQAFDQQGMYFKAESLYRQAMVTWQRSLGVRDPVVGDIMNNRVVLLTKQGKFEQAESLCDRVLKIVGETVGGRHRNYAAVLNSQAGLLRAQGKYEMAESLCRRVLEIWEESLGPEHPNTAVAYNNLAELLRVQGAYDEADPLYRRALEVDVNHFGPNHPQVATDLNNRAELLRAQGKYFEAGPMYTRAREVWERALGTEHPNVAIVLNNQAELLADQGKYAEAEWLNNRALEIDEKVFGSDHLEVATALNNRAWLLECRGEDPEAEALYERSQAIRERALGDDHPAVAESLNNRAVLLMEKEMFQEARPLFTRALAIFENALGEQHPLVATTRDNLASTSTRQKRKETMPLRRRFSRLEKKLSRNDSYFSSASYGNLSRMSSLSTGSATI